MTSRAAATALAVVLVAPACGRDEPRTITAAEVMGALESRGPARVRQVTRIVLGGSPQMSATAAGVVDAAADRAAVTVTYDAGGHELGFVDGEEVADGDTLYLRRPGGRWFHTTAERGGANPLVQVRALRALRSFTRTGHGGEVGGVPTDRYLGESEPSLRTLEVWVTREGLPMRLVVEYVPGTSYTLDLGAHGSAAPVRVPTRSTRVADITALFEAARR